MKLKLLEVLEHDGNYYDGEAVAFRVGDYIEIQFNGPDNKQMGSTFIRLTTSELLKLLGMIQDAPPVAAKELTP